MTSSPSSEQTEFIAFYNNVLQPLSVDLEVGGCYTTSGKELIEITAISVSGSTITYVKLASDGTKLATTASVTGHDFFKLLETGLTVDRTFGIVQTGSSSSIYTMTSDVSTDTKVDDAVKVAKAAAQKAAADKAKMVAGPPQKSIPPASAASATGPDIERIEDKLYPKMEAYRKANIAYSKGVNIPVTLTISDGRKFKFQILECKLEENSGGKYRYNVWSSERTFYRELSKCFDDIKAKYAGGHYYHQDIVGRSRWFQITQVDFDSLISAKTGINGWEISQFIDGVSGAAVDKIKLTDGKWAVDAISKPMLGFKESDQMREEGGNKSNTDVNTTTVVHKGAYKVSPNDAAATDDAKLTIMLDFYVEKDYAPMDGSWQCVTCYLVTIRPTPSIIGQPERTQFPAHLKNFFSANLKPSDKIDAGKIGASLTAALEKTSVKKVEPRRRWWLTNTGGLQFIMPASEYRTWAKLNAEIETDKWWTWYLPATTTSQITAIPGKWKNKNPLLAVGIIKDDTIADAAANTNTNKAGRDVDVHGTCTFNRPKNSQVGGGGDELENCTFIMRAPTTETPFSVVFVKLIPPPTASTPTPDSPTMYLKHWLTLKNGTKFLDSIKLEINTNFNFFVKKDPEKYKYPEIAVAYDDKHNKYSFSNPRPNGYMKLLVSTNAPNSSVETIFFPTVNPDPDTVVLIKSLQDAPTTSIPAHTPAPGTNEYRMVLNGDINFRILKTELVKGAVLKTHWIVDTVCENTSKLKTAAQNSIVAIDMKHMLIPGPSTTGYEELINNVRPSLSAITGPHQYTKPNRNVCLGGAVSMAFSITDNEYRAMRDALIAKPQGIWELKDAGNSITNSTWKRDAAAESGEYNVSDGIGGGSGADKIGKPGGMAFDLEGNLLVADSDKHCIHIFNRKTGNSLGKIGSGPPGTTNCLAAAGSKKTPAPACCFNSPQDVKFNPNDGVDGQLVVCDTGNNRIVIIDYATGEEMRNIDLETEAGLHGYNPSSISILKIVKNSNDTETFLIVYYHDKEDAFGHNGSGHIRFFNMLSGKYAGDLLDPETNTTLSLGKYSPDKFAGSIAVDSDNNLIIADPANNRIVTCAMIIKDKRLTVVKINKKPIQTGDKINGVFISGSRIFMTNINEVMPSNNALMAGSYTIENSNSDTKKITIDDAPEYGEECIVKTVPDKTITSVTAYTDGAIFVSDTTDNIIRVYTDKKAELAKSLKPLDRTADYSDAGKAAYDVKIAEAKEKIKKNDDAIVKAKVENNQGKLIALKAEKDQLEKELKAAESGKEFHESREKAFAAKKTAIGAKTDADQAQRNVTWNWKWKIFLTDTGKTQKGVAIATAENMKETAEQTKSDAKTAVDDAGRAHYNARADALDAENGVSQKSLNLQKELYSGEHTDPAMTPPQLIAPMTTKERDNFDAMKYPNQQK